MRNRYILLILAIVVMSYTSTDLSALNVKDVFFESGLELPHKVYDPEVKDSLSANIDAEISLLAADNWWSVSTADTTLNFDTKSMAGLVANDFDWFYHNDSIGKMTPLIRETPENLAYFERCKTLMNDCRETILIKGVLIAASDDLWYGSHQYNMESGCFMISLAAKGIKVEESDRIYSNRIQMEQDVSDGKVYSLSGIYPVVLENMHKHFGTKEEWDRIYNRTKVVPCADLIIPIANRQVALMIEECEPVVSWQRPVFELFYKARLENIDDGCLSHLVLDDIFLIHTKTGEIVWSASSGDHSMEVTLE